MRRGNVGLFVRTNPSVTRFPTGIATTPAPGFKSRPHSDPQPVPSSGPVHDLARDAPRSGRVVAGGIPGRAPSPRAPALSHQVDYLATASKQRRQQRDLPRRCRRQSCPARREAVARNVRENQPGRREAPERRVCTGRHSLDLHWIDRLLQTCRVRMQSRPVH
jgi:hypothetical protein